VGQNSMQLVGQISMQFNKQWRRAGRDGHVLQALHSRRNMQQFLTGWIGALRSADSRAVRWVVDVDPIDVKRNEASNSNKDGRLHGILSENTRQ